MASEEAQQEFDNLMRDKQRRQTHPEDDNEHEHEDELSRPGLSHEPPQGEQHQNKTSNRDKIPRTRFGANTGPKGVISDAQNFRDSKRTHQAAVRASLDTTAPETGLKLGQQLGLERLQLAEEQGDLEDIDDDDDDDLDDDFVANWRQQRLQALQNGENSSKIHERSGVARQYGRMMAVDGEGYLEAIESSGAGVVVVVYISDDASEISQLFEDCLKSLAVKHTSTRFVKLDYDEAEIQVAGVPGIIAYRDGEKFAAIIPLLDDMPDDGDLDADTVEKVLQRHQILT